MRRSAVLLWLIRHPAVVAWAVLLPVLFAGFRLFQMGRAYFLKPAVAPVGYVAVLPAHVPDEVLVRLRAPATAGTLSGVVRAAGALRAEPIRGTGLHRLKLPAGRSVREALVALAGMPGIEWAEPNYRVRTCRVPEGPRFAELWGLRNIGRTFVSRNCGTLPGTPGADMLAADAWERTRGSRQVVVGILDTGIDRTHPNLKANLWTNPGEIPDNGIDDDRNGYVDDVHGYDFVNRQGDPKDDNGHGTHVAGSIGAAGSDGTGVVGVNWEVRLMALKFLSAEGWGSIGDAVEAIAYARSFGVRITNNSWGGGGFSRSLYEAIRTSRSLFVAAAGNSATDCDLVPAYPAAYDLPNIISVAASDPRDDLGCFSNYGLTSVDVAAPGVSILSTLPTYPCALTQRGLKQGYDYLDGTSMATGNASGAVALLAASFPRESDAQRRHRLIATARGLDSFLGRCVGNGCINLKDGVTTRLVPPIAEAGCDTAAPPEVPVLLDGAASVPYPGRHLASFVWSENGKVLHRSRHPAFTYRSREKGTHQIDLAVVDNENQIGRDRVRVVIADQVMAASALTLERQGSQTLAITLSVQDVKTKAPVADAAGSLLLVTPGPLYFRAEGRTDREGKLRTAWKGPGRLRPGRYEAQLITLGHSRYLWDRKPISGRFEN